MAGTQEVIASWHIICVLTDCGRGGGPYDFDVGRSQYTAFYCNLIAYLQNRKSK